MHHWKTQVLFQKRSGELCSRKPLSGSLTHGINITNYHTMCEAQRLIAEGQMGAVEVNTAFCWRTRVRAEHAKLQWPGESDLPQDEPSAETQHVSTPSSIKGWGPPLCPQLPTRCSPGWCCVAQHHQSPCVLAPGARLRGHWRAGRHLWYPNHCLPCWQSWNTFFCFYSLLLPFQELACVFLNVLGF